MDPDPNLKITILTIYNFTYFLCKGRVPEKILFPGITQITFASPPFDNFGHITQIWTLLDTLDSSDSLGRCCTWWTLLDILDPF